MFELKHQIKEETETIQQSVVKVPEQTTQRSEVKINSKKIIS